MTEWNNERGRGFWEACGLIIDTQGNTTKLPDGELIRGYPDITDLNALFKYAVPKVIELGDSVTILCLPHNSYEVEIQLHNGHPVHYETVSAINRDIALCLAEAIEKVIVKS